MFLGIAIVVWIAAGILSYGIWVNYSKREFSYFPVGKLMTVVLLGLGPLSLLSAVCVLVPCRPYGFDLRPYTSDERWRNFAAEYNTLTYTYKNREEFDKEY